MSIARKLFRLFKSLMEYQKIKLLLKGDLPQFEKIMNVVCRASFLWYWFFDNLSVLIKIKFINSLDFNSINRKACKFWLLGCLTGMFLAVYSMINDMKKEAELLLKAKIKPSDSADAKPSDDNAWKQEWKKLQEKKKTNLLNFIKNGGDAITASQTLGYPKRFFGFSFSESIVGLGGFTSAAITCY